MENPARRFLALLRQLFKRESREVRSGCHGATVWRIAQSSKPGEVPLGSDGDIEFIRIHASRRQ